MKYYFIAYTFQYHDDEETGFGNLRLALPSIDFVDTNVLELAIESALQITEVIITSFQEYSDITFKAIDSDSHKVQETLTKRFRLK